MAEEERCDAERYADLDSEEEILFDMDEEEREEYVEEKRKRRKMDDQNKRFRYGYDKKERVDSSERANEGEGMQEGNDDDQEEEPREEGLELKCNVPAGMKTPTTKQQAEIIERTARFITSSESDPAQMEILIQAKQSQNPLFAFLSRDHALHAYYRHVSWLMQAGLFGYGSEDDEEEEEEEEREGKGKAKEGAKATDQLDTAEVGGSTPPWRTGVVGLGPSLAGSTTPVSGSSPARGASSGQSVIVPPPDLKLIVDKTAAFVAKSGPSLESRIRDKNGSDPRFGFLLPWNEFHGYYRSRVDAEAVEVAVADGETARKEDGADKVVEGVGQGEGGEGEGGEGEGEGGEGEGEGGEGDGEGGEGEGEGLDEKAEPGSGSELEGLDAVAENAVGAAETPPADEDEDGKRRKQQERLARTRALMAKMKVKQTEGVLDQYNGMAPFRPCGALADTFSRFKADLQPEHEQHHCSRRLHGRPTRNPRPYCTIAI
ncbi:hypothetical protein BC936DRAFT_148162 [Jimgerdemannia flammicorona]|uniref:SURP motif domain-containing protein n=1 Tax=Jimgerdemannia flammicorona TaxID=994334 RepID=A0A433D3V2_9FUNG|nr:hypothetical protein BC936DRAFT_148162 [Jimgerdemannia flammicorona]